MPDILTPSEFMSPNSTSVQKLLNSNMNLQVLRTNAILKKDEWVSLDTRIISVAQERLAVVQDLIDAGLTHQEGGIGTTISQWQRETDVTDAEVTMEPDAEVASDVLSYDLDQVPIPIIHKDFRLGLRQIEASRRNGSNIDLTNSEAAARRVAVGMEDLVIKGYPSPFAGQHIYGLINHPQRIQGTADGPWTNATMDNVYQTILKMLEAADSAHRYGPFNLYIPQGYSTLLWQYYTDGSGQTLENRLSQIKTIRKISVSDRIPANNVVLVQMQSDTIDIAVAQALMPIEWDAKGGLVTYFKVLCSMAPRIKPDALGNLGIVHFTIPTA